MTENAYGHEHSHEQSHGRSHGHTHTNTKAVQNRLAKAAGQLDRVSAMVGRDEDCSDVLQQLSAVIGALRSAGRLIMRDHLEHCLSEAVEEGNMDSVNRFREAIELFMK